MSGLLLLITCNPSLLPWMGAIGKLNRVGVGHGVLGGRVGIRVPVGVADGVSLTVGVG